MTRLSTHYSLNCACGANPFDVTGAPVMRAYCHCLNCQAYNQAPYGDFLVYRKNQVVFHNEENTQFKAFQPPPLVRRGSCVKCGKPVLEKANIPLFPQLTLVPAINHTHPQDLPPPAMHMFYNRSVIEMTDRVPKYSGYVGSQTPFLWELAKALLATRT